MLEQFELGSQASFPLAVRMRPQSLDEFVGQEHILGKGRILRRIIEEDKIQSLILWGPPGAGKTALAHIIAKVTKASFIGFSAVTSGVKEIKEVIKEASNNLKVYQRRTILFVDEIHRFNKLQQDAFLPHIEKGTITLIGATTENPSFEVISPLLSRCKVFLLYRLKEKELEIIIRRALADKESGLGNYPTYLHPQALRHMVRAADGDARIALNALELTLLTVKPKDGNIREITLEIVEEVMQKRALLYDKGGEEHYNLISALHKSMRGSDPDATLYWLVRMITAGEDPLYICRRLIRFASEDIGNADPQALTMAISAMQAFHFIGPPEGELALAQAAIYLACAPKSNTIYKAWKEVQEEIKNSGSLPVPLHLRNAPTKLMKEIGYGKGYQYPHDFPSTHLSQDYLPERLKGKVFYHPQGEGFEEVIKNRMKKRRRD